ncbi:hypothetical protein SDC9_151869 [bioreactor metagenome]|uniref:Uncharacterized protein n=1 Tax=bioreactor metagenome TaxID=1076179 RepID=A0A645EVX1_9ZZZZ
MYLVARQYMNCDYPDNDDVTSDAQSRSLGEAWMKKAAEAGHAKARFLLLDREAEKAMIGRLKQMLPEVQVFCDMNYSPAFLLKAKILDRLNLHSEAAEAYQIAAARGEHQAWRILAQKQENLKKEKSANEYWGKFIQADRESRKQNRYDIFYPQIKVDVKLQPWMMSPEEVKEYRLQLKENINIDIAED